MKNKKRFIAVIAIALITVLLLVTLTACGPSSIDAAKKKMEKKGYTVLAYKAEDGTGGIACSKGLLGDKMTAVLYESSKDAKAAAEKSGAQQIGKWVVAGSDAAIKDFK